MATGNPDIRLQEVPTPPHLPTGALDEGLLEQRPEKKIRKLLLLTPILSILVGGGLFVAEVTLIAVVLSSPGTLGINDDIALSSAQRYVLGAITIVMLVEAFLLGTIDTGVERRRIKVLKHRQKLIEKHLQSLKDSVRSSGADMTDSSAVLSSDRLALLLIGHLEVSENTDPRSLMDDVKESTQELAELQLEINKDTLQYVAALLFELASFLWKWALALLVISNNWISVGVAIAGGVVYPVVVFWQKSLMPKR